MKLKSLTEASDEALIMAHLQAAEPDAAKASLASTEAGRAMLEADADRRAKLAARGIELWIKGQSRDSGKVASALLRANRADWTSTRLATVVEAAAALNREHEHFGGFDWFPHKPLISAVENAAERGPLPAELRAALERWKAALMPRALTSAEERELGEAERVALGGDDSVPWAQASAAFATMERLERIRMPKAEERKLIERLSRLLSAHEKGQSQEPVLRIDTTDTAGVRIAADTSRGGRASGRAWAELLQHARSLSATTPSAKWLAEAAAQVATVDATGFGACVSDWFNEAGKPAPQKLVSHRGIADVTLLNDCSVELLKGLAWVVTAARRSDVAPALGNLAAACFQKVRNVGPRNVKVGNAAVAALAALESPEAASQLARLKLGVKHPSSRATIAKALAAMSQRTGISPEDLAEMSVPAFGLEPGGTRRMRFGKCACVMEANSAREVKLRWSGPDGKPCESLPAAVKEQFADELKRLQREAKDAATMLAAQALRLERSPLEARSWPLEVWRKRFLDHPLVGTLARRLIWKFGQTLAVPWKGGFVAADGRSIAPKKSSNISLWHPIQSSSDEVMAWRHWLEKHEVTQPFKQAHREIYVLTDAERRTKTYSNRFAGHILRQHQFAALCQQRGWEYRVQGDFDSHSTPTLLLSAQGLRIEFWMEAVENELSPQGIYLYLASDQVRFGRPVTNVPAVVFSEVMRDADLFVGVASVANDPTWRDSGPAGRCRTYWENWSFGELSESAKTRGEILRALLPRLAGPDRFSLSGRFLTVRGQLRTYNIHLGSGNILMEPNDQYLCIVPDRGAAVKTAGQRLFLPFEGDTTLSVILSKALLLAEDAKIKDQSIVRQIKSK